MTEAIIITAIIVGGIVALAGIVLHFGYKAWLIGQSQQAGDGAVQIQVAGDGDLEAIARRMTGKDQLNYLSAN